MQDNISYIEKNITSLSDDYKKNFIIEFKHDLERHKAYIEKTGIGTYLLLKNLPDVVLYKMRSFIQTRLPTF